ncbi:hypothetical protein LJC11_01320 [Bacteroidales bacterium OttesenSCG-928-I21]|nr:hypothetical protein [Bacteroidales bacterium OttesenSCG-928-I21]
MKKNIAYIIFVVLILLSRELRSQTLEMFFSEDKPSIENSSKFSISIDNSNFFKNNEYFNKFSDGYTLFGYFLKPKIVFNPNDKLKMYAGFHYHKYFGAKDFGKIEPVFTVEYMPTKNISVIFGELYGTVNHDLTDFVLDNEHYFTQNSENGLQFIFNNDRIKSDTWINWKQFIFKNSPFSEILLIGTSNKFNLINKNDKYFFDIKLAVLGSHVGGQINTNNDPIETMFNVVAGPEYNFNIGNKYLDDIKLSSLYHAAIDGSPTKKLAYTSGYGVLSSILLNNKFLALKIEHWYGNSYFSKFGNPMFQSISSTHENYLKDKRAFVNAHLFWSYQAFTFFKIGAGFDLFYDLYMRKIDYSFGFYIKTNFNFKLKK